MTLITASGLDLLEKMKREGLKMPDDWEEDVKHYIELKKKAYEMRKEECSQYEKDCIELIVKARRLLQK